MTHLELALILYAIGAAVMAYVVAREIPATVADPRHAGHPSIEYFLAAPKSTQRAMVFALALLWGVTWPIEVVRRTLGSVGQWRRRRKWMRAGAWLPVEGLPVALEALPAGTAPALPALAPPATPDALDAVGVMILTDPRLGSEALHVHVALTDDEGRPIAALFACGSDQVAHLAAALGGVTTRLYELAGVEDPDEAAKATEQSYTDGQQEARDLSHPRA